MGIFIYEHFLLLATSIAMALWLKSPFPVTWASFLVRINTIDCVKDTLPLLI
jgi:hypothetical protein